MAVIKTLILISVIMLPMMMMAHGDNPGNYFLTLNGSCVSTFRLGSRVCNWRRWRGDNRFLCERDRTNIRHALENHEENKNKDLSSTICEYVSLECTPQVRYNTEKFRYNMQ